MSLKAKKNKMVRLIVEELWVWYETALSWIPGRIGMRLRGLLYTPFLRSAGPGLKISEYVHIWHSKSLSLGRNCRLGRNNQINAVGEIQIGDNVMFGPYVMITSSGHEFVDIERPMNRQGSNVAPVLVADDVWIGAHSCILSGVSIGNGAIVAAGAVVTADVAPFSIVAGVPARHLKWRLVSDPGELQAVDG